MLVAFGAVGLVILGVLELLWPSRSRYPIRQPPRAPEPRPASPQPTSLAARRARSGPADATHRRLDAPAPPAEPPANARAADLLSPVAPAAAVTTALTPTSSDPMPLAPVPPEGEIRELPAPVEVADEIAGPATDAPVAAATAEEPAVAIAAPAVAITAPAAAADPVPVDDPMIQELARVSAEPPVVDEAATPAARCAALIDAGRVDEAIALAEATLQETPGASDAQSDGPRARLWGLLGRARQARGDHDGARTALESAIAAAPRLERGEWERHLVTLAVATARSLLTRSQDNAAGEEAIACVRGALGWLETALALAPGDRDVRETLTAVRGALWPTYGKAAVALSQRGDFVTARRRLREALEDQALPAARRRSFTGLLTTTYSDEARALTGEAMRAMKDGRDDEAMGTLARAEDVVTLVPAEGATRARRLELERRLWWNYMRLGTRRLEQGAGEDALDALFRALAFDSVGADRLGETRGMLVRAFETLTETRRVEVEELLERGERDAAAAAADRLAGLLRSGTERGLAPEDLAEVVSRAQDVFGRLDRRE